MRRLEEEGMCVTTRIPWSTRFKSHSEQISSDETRQVCEANFSTSLMPMLHLNRWPSTVAPVAWASCATFIVLHGYKPTTSFRLS